MLLEALETRYLLAPVAWDGGGDAVNWTDPLNWDGDQLPGSADDVLIDVSGAPTIRLAAGAQAINSLVSRETLELAGGSLDIATASQIEAGLNLSGGTLTGSGDVTVTGLLSWTGGTMSGTGMTEARGGLQIRGGAIKTFLGRTLSNYAGATWSDSGRIDSYDFAGTLINQPGATFDIQCDAGWNVNGVVPNFTNHGRLTKSAGSGTAQIDAAFDNTGSVEVQQGSLSLAGGGIDTGSFTVDSDTILQFAGGTHALNAGSSVSGAGAVYFSAGMVNMDGASYDVSGGTYASGGTANFLPAATVQSVGPLNTWWDGILNFSSGEALSTSSWTQNGGELTGSDTVTVTGLLSWARGTMSGTGVTEARGGLQISGDGYKYLSGRTLSNYAEATWSGSSAITSNLSGGTLMNQSGATFDIQGDAGWNVNGVVPNFTNQGRLIKSAGSGTAQIDAAFDNTGSVEVQQGSLSLAGGGLDTGSFTVDSDTILQFAGGTHALNAGSSVSGAGAVYFSAGRVNLDGTRYGVSGGTWASGGTANFLPAATVQSVGPLNTWWDGILNFSSGEALSTSSWTQNGGELTGSDTVTVTGLLSWARGTMSGTGVTEARGGLQISGDGYKYLSGRTLSNYAEATWSGSSAIESLNSGGTLINQPGATFDIQGDPMWSVSGLPASFSNQGRLIKSAGSGTAQIEAAFHNAGSVEVQQGSLSLAGGGTLPFDGSAFLASVAGTAVGLTTSLTGTTTNADLFQPTGTVIFTGGDSASPRLLEAMSRDLGPSSAGFHRNFGYGTLTLDSAYVRLIDTADNAPGTGAEALYVDTLIVPAGSTLDLNLLQVYARVIDVSGTVLGGTINVLPDGGPLPLNSWTSGKIAVVGEVDEWTFFGRRGQAVTVFADPGDVNAPPPANPTLGCVELTLLDPTGNVLASDASTSEGPTVYLLGIELPADGTYRIRLKTPPAFPMNVGNYYLSLYDATIDTVPLVVNQRSVGILETPYSIDRWTFTSNAQEQVRFDWLNASSAAIQFRLLGPSGWVGFADLAQDSLALPYDGDYVLEAYTNGTASGSYAMELQQTTQTALTLGTPYNGKLAGGGQMQLFRVDVTGEQQLRLQLDDTSAADQNELYAKFGSPPTRADYTYRYDRLASADQELLVPMAAPGTWYVLLYADKVPAPSTYTLLATASALSLTDVTPDRLGNGADMVLTLSGAGFTGHSSVELVASDNTTYAGTLADLITPTQATVTFAAGRVPPGRYLIRATNSGFTPAVLPDAFEAVAAGQAKLETNLVVPGAIGYHQPATCYIEYANTGQLAMPAPLLELRAVQNGREGALMTLDSSRLAAGVWSTAVPDGLTHTIHLLASGSTPGVLQPGESFRVPVYWAGWQLPWDMQYPVINFSLGVVTVDDPQPINWDQMREATRSGSMSTAAWDALWPNLVAHVGTTWGDYVRVLDDNASYLGRLGQRVSDVGELWSFEVMQAFGFNQLSVLENVADPRLATPGLKLMFQRFFSGCILGRNELTTFGRGWFPTWTRSLEVQSDGTVMVTQDWGFQRRFQPDLRGGFFSPPGDEATLSVLPGGGYQLREPGGVINVYSSAGRFEYAEDTNHNRLTAGYTGSRLTSLTHSSGQWLHIAYNAAGFIESLTDSEGRASTFAYDGDLLVAATDPDGQTTVYTYQTSSDPRFHGELLSQVKPSGARYYSYDAEGRLIGTTREGGTLPVTYVYDTAGGVTTIDALGSATHQYFDGQGHGIQVAQQDPLGNFTYFAYDSERRLTQATDAAGHQAKFAYDTHGNLVRYVNPLGATMSFAYDTALDSLVTATDANGNTTRYVHNAAGNLIAMIYPDGNAETAERDAAGNQIGHTNRRGQTTDYVFDAAGRLTDKTYPDGSQEHLTYDGHGNVKTVVDASGTTAFDYNTADRLTRVTYPSGRYLQYSYDAAGRRTQMRGSDDYQLNYTYDTNGRLQSLVDSAAAAIVSYHYDPAGRLSRKDLGNGTWTTYEYDASGQVLHLVNYAPGGAINSRFDYTYDVVGRRTGMTTLAGEWTYAYDAAGQLIHAVFVSNDPAAVPNQDLTYVYDAVGNRIRTIENGATTEYTTNNLNQYTRIGAATLTYDADGNLVRQTEGGQSSTFSYNWDNLLTAAATPEGSFEYEYTYFRARAARSENGVQTEYLLDPFGLVNVVAEYDAAGSLVAQFTYGQGLTSRTAAHGSQQFYDFDALGSVVGLSDAAGGYLNAYAYLPFGQLLASTGSTANPFQFVGQFGVTAESDGLSFMRRRFYDQVSGMFTGIDPLRPTGTGLYNYVANDPLRGVDPQGLKASKGNEEEPISEPVTVTGVNSLHVTSALTGQPIGEGSGGRGGIGDGGGTHGGGGGSDGQDNGSHDDPGPGAPLCTGDDCSPKNPSFPQDPNAKTGAAGFGAAGFVPAGSTLPYRVDFENDASATAPAQRVEIVDQLSGDLDWKTLYFTEVGCGDQLIAVSSNSQYFETAVDMNYNDRDFQVEIRLALDAQTGKVTAVFQSIDPATDLPPDVLTGFLPPEDGTGRGRGQFSYIVEPKPDLPTGTEIRNVALIQFDFGEIIATNQIDPHDPSKGTDQAKEALNTIDASAPISSVQPLPAASPTRAVLVTWSGSDSDGSGIAAYDVFYTDNGGAPQRWLTAAPATSGTFLGTPGHTYAFYSVATDAVGYRETKAVAGEATTTIRVPTTSAVLATNRSGGAVYGEAISFTVTVSADDPGAGVPTGSVQWLVDGAES